MVKRSETHACAAYLQNDEWLCVRCNLRWERGEDVPESAVCIPDAKDIAVDEESHKQAVEDGHYWPTTTEAPTNTFVETSQEFKVTEGFKEQCEAVQYSDQMVCKKCDIAWDMNDPEPPRCDAELDKRIPRRAEAPLAARPIGCGVEQRDSMMFCPKCSTAWEVGDPEPPKCRNIADDCEAVRPSPGPMMFCKRCDLEWDLSKDPSPQCGKQTAACIYFRKEEVEEMLEMLYGYPALDVVEGLMRKFKHAKKILDG